MIKKPILVLILILICSVSLVSKYASKVLDSTSLVEEPENALGKPNGSYAEVGIFGNLDLELNVTNGSGNDISVYAKRTEEGILPETYAYGVYAMDKEGEWVLLGVGGGMESPEEFDLGELKSTKQVRIVFKDMYESAMNVSPMRLHPMAYRMNIDAVVSIHAAVTDIQ